MSRPLRILLVVVLIAAAVVVLFLWVFPWVESQMQDPTIGVSVADGTTQVEPATA